MPPDKILIAFCRRIPAFVLDKSCLLYTSTMSVVASDKELYGKKEEILNALKKSVHPDSVVAEDNLAIIAVVGRGMVRAVGTAGRVFSALSREKINVRMIDQGSSELRCV